MEQLFVALSNAVESAPLIALAAAVAWGIISIVLSPCHLASIPLIVGFISDQPGLTSRRSFGLAGLFSLGILVTIALIGVITAALGRMAGDIGMWGEILMAGVFFVVGLHLLDVIPMPFSGPGKVGMKRKGMLAAFILGLVFGIALGPCTFAFMAPVLAATFKVAGTAPIYAAGLLLAYGIGHCGVIALAGGSTEAVQRYLHWNESSRSMVVIKRVCGAIVLLGGLYLLYKAI